MADVVDNAAYGQVVIALFLVRVWLAAAVVAHDPQHAQRGNRAVRHVVVEILEPQIDTELVGDARIELRKVLDPVARRRRSLRANDDRLTLG